MCWSHRRPNLTKMIASADGWPESLVSTTPMIANDSQSLKALRAQLLSVISSPLVCHQCGQSVTTDQLWSSDHYSASRVLDRHYHWITIRQWSKWDGGLPRPRLFTSGLRPQLVAHKSWASQLTCFGLHYALVTDCHWLNAWQYGCQHKSVKDRQTATEPRCQHRLSTCVNKVNLAMGVNWSTWSTWSTRTTQLLLIIDDKPSFGIAVVLEYCWPQPVDASDAMPKRWRHCCDCAPLTHSLTASNNRQSTVQSEARLTSRDSWETWGQRWQTYDRLGTNHVKDRPLWTRVQCSDQCCAIESRDCCLAPNLVSSVLLKTWDKCQTRQQWCPRQKTRICLEWSTTAPNIASLSIK